MIRIETPQQRGNALGLGRSGKETDVPNDTLMTRFLAKVNPPDAQGCNLWSASLNRSGYGTFNVHGASKLAHRVAYEMFIGPIPDGLSLDHVCHNLDTSCGGGPKCKHRRCTNVHHLEPVTRRENSARGRSPHANRVLVTHCKRGHSYNEENTYINATSGKRQCRACLRIHDRKRGWRR